MNQIQNNNIKDKKATTSEISEIKNILEKNKNLLKDINEKIYEIEKEIYSYIIEDKDIDLNKLEDEIKNTFILNETTSLELSDVVKNQNKLFLSKNYDLLNSLADTYEKNKEKIIKLLRII